MRQLPSNSVYRKYAIKEEEYLLDFLVYLLPVSCFYFVNNLVCIIVKVHKDDTNIGFNTIGATLGLLLITGAIVFAPQM